MANHCRIRKVVGPAISGTAGTKAKTFTIFDITAGVEKVLHVEVANADVDDPLAWQTALEAVSPGYTIDDWT